MARRALIVGLSQYPTNIGSLNQPPIDAERMAQIIEEYGEYIVERLPQLWNKATNKYEIDPQGNVTSDDLANALKKLLIDSCQDGQNIEALIYFAGHGFTFTNNMGRQRGALAVSNTQIITENNQIIKCEDAILFDDLNTLIQKSQVQNLVLILDCCHSGFFIERAITENSFSFIGRRNYYCICACQSLEKSWVLAGDDHSIFSQAVINGLDKANANDQGKITTERLYDHIQSQLSKKGPKFGQTAIKVGWGEGINIVSYSNIDFKKLNNSSKQKHSLNKKSNHIYLTRRNILKITEFATLFIGSFSLGLGGIGLWKRFLQKNINQVAQEEPSVRVDLPVEPSVQKSNPITEEPFLIITVNEKGEEINRRQGSAKILKEQLNNGVMLEMVYIPGGSFTIGVPPNEKIYDKTGDEAPQKKVNISDFWMGKYEITQGQHEQVMGYNPSHFKGNKKPVENVTWNMAQEFCQELSRLTGKKYRLPSESEWEYAARAGTNTPFHFGETLTAKLANYDSSHNIIEYDSSNKIKKECPKDFQNKETTDVGSFYPNTFGLYDIHGNVWEWCADDTYPLKYKSYRNYNELPTDGSPRIIPGSDTKIVRGGSWCSLPIHCRLANRSYYPKDSKDIHTGFRIALDLL